MSDSVILKPEDLPVPPEPAAALVFTHELLDQDFAKTCHGLLRGSARFRPVAVLDQKFAGRDAGEVMDGRACNVPVLPSLSAFLDAGLDPPDFFVVGVAFSGGRLPERCRGEIVAALERGMTVVCGLHQLLGDDPELRQAAERGGGRLLDVRRPRPTEALRFWTGDVLSIRARVLGVLGTD
ncbi:MAG: DUF1611 domain-containing protein, partial [Rhodothermales bacterium]|nr:DUF1611 domain-containing protein [Rhodothermales bacterium]